MRRTLLLAVTLPLVAAGMAEANRLYRAENYRAAAEGYARLYQAGDSSAALRYNLGTALLRLRQWEPSRGPLESATDSSVPPELRQRARYNAGNAALEPVFLRRVAEPAAREEQLRRAIAHYQEALLARPGDREAKWNLELALRLLGPPPPQSGGGGGGGGAGGGGAGEGPQSPTPRPAPAPQSAPVPELSQQQAEQILTGASAAERDAQREVRSRSHGARTAVRDW